jgi:autotransporter-associated beta strand protein
MTVTGTVDPASITVSSNTTSYTLGGSGTIGGVASLTKSGTTTLTISNTGTNTFTGGVTLNSGVLNFKLGSSLGTGTVTLNGGTLTSTGGIAFGNNFNVTAPSIWNVGGGPTYWAGALSGTAPLTLNSSGVFTPSGSWAAYSSTLSISGLVRLNQGTSMGSSAAAFNFGSSGNVYNEAAAETDVTINLGSLSGSSGSYLSGSSNAGPAVDTYVIGALNTSTTFGGIIQDGSNATPHTGALTKVGTGTLTLIGAETYSGATTVEAGTLVLAGTGSISSGSGSTVEVTSGSTLTITSTAADAITADTTLIDSGGTLTGGGTINGGVTNNGTITANSGGTFTITGDVANNGTLKLTNGTALSATGAFVNDGTLDVRQGAQTLPPNLVNNGTVLVAINLTWKGATSTAWDSATANWLNGGTGTTYGDGDYVTFADAPITSTVAISSAVSPGSLTFTNATTAYMISGAAISGTTSLVKSGAGTVTLSSANAYTGGTSINAGMISLNGANASTAFTAALGTGTIALNGGELLLDPPGGTPGQTSSTFTNNSVLNGGILYGNDGQEHLTGTISVTAATTLLRQWNNSTADQSKGLLLDGALSGPATLNVYGTGGTTSQGARTWIDHAANTYSGTVTVYASAALSGFSAPLGGNSLGLGSNTALQDATVDIEGTRTSGSTDATELYGLQFGNGVTAPVLGALMGTGKINLVTFDTGSPPANLTVGGDNATTTFSGILSGAGGLTKAGTGTMTLSSGANTEFPPKR